MLIFSPKKVCIFCGLLRVINLLAYSLVHSITIKAACVICIPYLTLFDTVLVIPRVLLLQLLIFPLRG